MHNWETFSYIAEPTAHAACISESAKNTRRQYLLATSAFIEVMKKINSSQHSVRTLTVRGFYALHPYVFELLFLPLRFNSLPPVNFTVVDAASKGSSEFLTVTSVPLGTVTLSSATPEPVTAIQPKPAMTISYLDCFHPSPSI